MKRQHSRADNKIDKTDDKGWMKIEGKNKRTCWRKPHRHLKAL